MEKIENFKAENDIKKLFDSGLNFKYEFDWNNINKYMFCIEKEGCSIENIVSKLKENEILIFFLNDGQTWNGRMGNKHKMYYDKKFDESIYWKHRNEGLCVRVDSSMGSIREWLKTDKLFINLEK